MRVILYIVAGLLIFVIIGGVGYKIVAPTSKTVIEKGGRQVVLNTQTPQIPLGGCSIYKVNVKAYWDQGFNMNTPNGGKK